MNRLKQLLDLLQSLEPGAEDAPQSNDLSGYAIGKQVIVRTHSAGVFFATLKARNGRECVLENARRIWSWSGAFTLTAVAQNGVKEAKLSVSQPEQLVTEAIEILPVSGTTAAQLSSMEAHSD